MKFGAALLFVLSLMGGLALIMRKLEKGNPLMSQNRKRLKIVESLNIDARRKAVILKRDDKEHLVILGANSETVIESDIESHQDADIVPLKANDADQ
jgi:flagellar protein FliO/FliZ